MGHDLGEQERRKRVAYRRLNLHFLEIRAHFQHRAKAERPGTIRHKWAVWKKMCEILECEKVWLADASVGKILADYGYYPSGINKSPELGERVIYNEQSIGDLLVDIGNLYQRL